MPIETRRSSRLSVLKSEKSRYSDVYNGQDIYLSDSDSDSLESVLRSSKDEKKVKKSNVEKKKTVTKQNKKENDEIYIKPVMGTPRKNKIAPSENEEKLSTPPKVKKYEKDETCDNSKEVPKTPSTLLKQLALNSPENESNEKPIRKSLFKSVYQAARKALHSSTPNNMPGRQKELEKLKAFIRKHIEEKKSASLYISGPPGTGKTASLSIVLEEKEIGKDVQAVYVNCTSIKSAGAVYDRIIKEIGIKSSVKSEKECLSVIEKHFVKCQKMILLVLDEMDQLESKNQSVLYTIFEWPAKITSKIILIGIANALDLTDRILPRLQARCELKPNLLHFAPYSKQQIFDIINDRLKSADCMSIFAPAALQMLAAKVAAVSGDVRRALDIARRVVEIIERDQQKDVLRPLENFDDFFDDENIKTVDLKEVVSVLNNVYGTSQNLSDDCDDAFPLQQKIIICSLLLILKKAKNKDVTIGRLHDVYKRVCTKKSLYAVDQAEFVGLCSLIETKGILSVSGKKEPRLHKVSLQWDEEEVIGALKDKTLISSILQDESCLGKM